MFLAVTHHLRMRCQSLNVTFLPFNILQPHFLHYCPQPPTYCYNTQVNGRTWTLYQHILEKYWYELPETNENITNIYIDEVLK